MLCVVSFFLGACDQNQTGERIERALEADQPIAGGQAAVAEIKPTERAAPSRQTNIAIAPGNIVVLALSAYDARAVVKSARGEMQAMKLGDVVQGTQSTLLDIMHDRLVFETFVTKPSGLKVKQIAWVYKAKGGVSRVQVLDQYSPEYKTYSVKKTIVVSE